MMAAMSALSRNSNRTLPKLPIWSGNQMLMTLAYGAPGGEILQAFGTKLLQELADS